MGALEWWSNRRMWLGRDMWVEYFRVGAVNYWICLSGSWFLPLAWMKWMNPVKVTEVKEGNVAVVGKNTVSGSWLCGSEASDMERSLLLRPLIDCLSRSIWYQKLWSKGPFLRGKHTDKSKKRQLAGDDRGRNILKYSSLGTFIVEETVSLASVVSEYSNHNCYPVQQ